MIKLWIICLKYFFPVCDYLDNFVIGLRTSGNLTSREFIKDVIFYTHSGSPVGCGETLNVTCHEGVTAYARSVFVWIPGPQRVLMICEFEVYTEGEYHSSISLKVDLSPIDVGVLCCKVSKMIHQYSFSLCHGTGLVTNQYPALAMAHLHIHIGIARPQCIEAVQWDCIMVSFF